MKTIQAYAIIASDGYVLMHTIRNTRREAIRTYEYLYNISRHEARTKKYQVTKLEILPGSPEKY